MKKTICFILLFTPVVLFAQQPSPPPPSPTPPPDKPAKKPEHHFIGIGVEAGFDFSNITNASMVGASSRTGYHLGVFLASNPKSILGSHTELIYSRRGYNYNDSASKANGSIDLDYIMLAQLVAINITKYVQIQLGGQTSYLLHAKTDSSQPSTGNASADQAISFYNRFDYGFALGAEIHPVSGLLVGARYNISLNNLYKSSTSYTPGTTPSFVPSASSINLKNNVIQLFIGWRF